jgi:hypothetical protein
MDGTAVETAAGGTATGGPETGAGTTGAGTVTGVVGTVTTGTVVGVTGAIGTYGTVVGGGVGLGIQCAPATPPKPRRTTPSETIRTVSDFLMSPSSHIGAVLVKDLLTTLRPAGVDVVGPVRIGPSGDLESLGGVVLTVAPSVGVLGNQEGPAGVGPHGGCLRSLGSSSSTTLRSGRLGPLQTGLVCSFGLRFGCHGVYLNGLLIRCQHLIIPQVHKDHRTE